MDCYGKIMTVYTASETGKTLACLDTVVQRYNRCLSAKIPVVTTCSYRVNIQKFTVLPTLCIYVFCAVQLSSSSEISLVNIFLDPRAIVRPEGLFK